MVENALVLEGGLKVDVNMRWPLEGKEDMDVSLEARSKWGKTQRGGWVSCRTNRKESLMPCHAIIAYADRGKEGDIEMA